ncbi:MULTISPECIES: hypothetical protein [Amycolatopsis]|uniref:DUF4231 domain-containing protein n=1 Tax=Amycolatopsis thermalba TaxID=944492 RepID=A0ABY4P4K6_9PSEU|nr:MULTISPECIES: hypothetical protein [Amycolatopsis]UQS27224.1 DUF4231 domain-containing protein [Amycolatopsis thermalba]
MRHRPYIFAVTPVCSSVTALALGWPAWVAWLLGVLAVVSVAVETVRWREERG